MDSKLIIKDIKAKKFEKIYFLHGEEAYYIDAITNAIIEHALEDHERDFNQTILYGKDANALNIISLIVVPGSTRMFSLSSSLEILLKSFPKNSARSMLALGVMP